MNGKARVVLIPLLIAMTQDVITPERKAKLIKQAQKFRGKTSDLDLYDGIMFLLVQGDMICKGEALPAEGMDRNQLLLESYDRFYKAAETFWTDTLQAERRRGDELRAKAASNEAEEDTKDSPVIDDNWTAEDEENYRKNVEIERDRVEKEVAAKYREVERQKAQMEADLAAEQKQAMSEKLKEAMQEQQLNPTIPPTRKEFQELTSPPSILDILNLPNIS